VLIARAITALLPDCVPVDIRIRYSRGKQSKSKDRRVYSSLSSTHGSTSKSEAKPPASAEKTEVPATEASSYEGDGVNQAFVFFQV
jgi:hypothetical protein